MTLPVLVLWLSAVLSCARPPLMSTPLSGWREDPLPVAAPRVSGSLTGTASWYAWRPGEAAAGPSLRRALGPSWRGRVVLVDGIRVRLTDWMVADRLVDLDSRTFAAIAPLSRGLTEVTISW